MDEVADPARSSWAPCVAYVLVVEKDDDYAQLLVSELQRRSVRAKHTKTVDDFLDLNCRNRVDLVSLEIDALDPETLDNIKLLRTHFGEGPGTRIVASSSFCSVRSAATSTGWVKYGSPDWRICPSCILWP